MHTILAYILLALPVVAGTIRGRVSDPGGQAVPFARVSLRPSGRTVTADGLGEFNIDGLPTGEYEVTATADGFEPETRGGIRVGAGSDATADLTFRKLLSSYTQVSVIGDAPEAALREIPGSASFVRRRELEETRPVDANEVLRRQPGVNVREDSGPAGLRMNIGVRGLNPDRSRTLLVLEDGLPLALAPYGEPEMYYSPPIDRMIGVEILKGSGSIVYGPQTIGGVLNFITPEPPLRQQTTVDLTGGQYGFFSGQASHGGTKGRAGWYVNLLRKQGDGWRDLFFGLNDVMAKLNVTLNDHHRLAWKFGGYDERSNSTYLGLTESQFRRDPGFNAVPDDFLRIRRYAGSLAHTFTFSPSAVLNTTAFGYSTTRNWRRQDFDRARAAGVEYLNIVGNPAIRGDAIYLRNSTGNNNREFDVIGGESRLGIELSRQRIETGFRYLYEEHRDRRVDGTSYIASTGMTREYEVRNGHAASAYIQDRIFLTPRLTLTPGLRFERYRYVRDIRRQPVAGVPTDVSIQRGDSVMKPIPGLGIAYQAAGPLTLFAGVHRGFAPPRIKDAITRSGVSLELDAELSWNYEAGARLALARGLRAEATVFETDFSNQIIPAAVSGGATTSLVNAGRTLHRGAEFSLAADWARLTRTGLFTEARYTWLPVARFESAEYAGNRLPYAPKATVSLEAGWRHRSGFQIGVDGTRAGSQFADNRETRQPSADGTTGLIPAYWVWNASAGKEFAREQYSVRPYITVKNMADALYISSRAPLGIQPGMARQVNGGIRLRF